MSDLSGVDAKKMPPIPAKAIDVGNINIQDKTYEFAMLIQFRTKEDFKAAMKGGAVYVGLFEYPAVPAPESE